MKSIDQLTTEEFATIGSRLSIVPLAEDFIITKIGRIFYAVSIEFGHAYTRPQLIEKYRIVGAEYLITKVTR